MYGAFFWAKLKPPQTFEFLNQARDASQSLYHSGEEPRRVVVKDVALLRRIQERRS
jgi:hypothetical protein